MNAQARYIIMVLVLLATIFAGAASIWAAVNTATDPGGGSVSLTASGNVTVTETALLLVKQVWSPAGVCLTSSPTVGACTNAGITVAKGTPLKFIIYVQNTTAFTLTDIRIQDALDITPGTGFTYTAGSLKYDLSTADTATIGEIYSAVDAGTVESDAVDTGAGNYASYFAGNITVGAVSGQANLTLPVPANKTFALEFVAIKN